MTLSEAKELLYINGVDVEIVNENLIKVLDKSSHKWINFYPSTQKYNYNNSPSHGKGLMSLIREVTGKTVPSTVTDGATKIRYKKLVPNAFPPIKKYVEDAGIDLFSLEDADWKRSDGFWIAEIKTGIALEIPPACHLATAPRSSSLFGQKINCFYSVLDCGYLGEVTFLLFYFGDTKPNKIKRGDRVAQVVYVKNPIISTDFIEIDELPVYSGRGYNGFGSTGSNQLINQKEIEI